MSAHEEVVIATQLAGQREFIAGVGQEEAALRGLRHEVERTGLAASTTAKRGFLMNQALFTMRRFAYSGTLALVGLGTASVYFGMKFNTTMENNTIAMAHFLGSTLAARKELDYLYGVAARTPFEFTQIADAARRFLAFGFSLQETNKYLNILGDTAAGLALDQSGVSRLAIIFGQMRASGRVLGGDLLQLAQAGVPALQILREQLHLTREQMANIGRLRIPSEVAIPALMAGLNARFKGAAREQAKTLTGQLSTLRDYTAQMLGTLTTPLFDRLRLSVIPKLNLIVGDMQRAMRDGGGFAAAIEAVDARLTPKSHRIMQVYTQLRGLFHDLNIVVRAFIGAVVRTHMVVAAMLAPFLVLRGVVWALAHTTAIWVPLLQVLLTVLIPYVIWTKAAAFWTRIWRQESQLVILIQKTGIAIEKTMNAVLATRVFILGRVVQLQRAWMVLTKGYLIVDGRFAKMTAFEKMLLRLRFRLFAARTALMGYIAATRAAIVATTTFLFTTPVGWIILAIAAIIAILVILYFKWDRFHDLVNRTFNWIVRHSPYIAAALTLAFGPLGAIAGLLLLILTRWDKVKDIWNWIKKAPGRFWNWLTTPTVGSGISGNTPTATQVARAAAAGGVGATPVVTSPLFPASQRRGIDTRPVRRGLAEGTQLQPRFQTQESWQPQEHNFNFYLDSEPIVAKVAKKTEDERARR